MQQSKEQWVGESQGNPIDPRDNRKDERREAHPLESPIKFASQHTHGGPEQIVETDLPGVQPGEGSVQVPPTTTVKEGDRTPHDPLRIHRRIECVDGVPPGSKTNPLLPPTSVTDVAMDHQVIQLTEQQQVPEAGGAGFEIDGDEIAAVHDRPHTAALDTDRALATGTTHQLDGGVEKLFVQTGGLLGQKIWPPSSPRGGISIRLEEGQGLDQEEVMSYVALPLQLQCQACVCFEFP